MMHCGLCFAAFTAILAIAGGIVCLAVAPLASITVEGGVGFDVGMWDGKITCSAGDDDFGSLPVVGAASKLACTTLKESDFKLTDNPLTADCGYETGFLLVRLGLVGGCFVCSSIALLCAIIAACNPDGVGTIVPVTGFSFLLIGAIGVGNAAYTAVFSIPSITCHGVSIDKMTDAGFTVTFTGGSVLWSALSAMALGFCFYLCGASSFQSYKQMQRREQQQQIILVTGGVGVAGLSQPMMPVQQPPMQHMQAQYQPMPMPMQQQPMQQPVTPGGGAYVAPVPQQHINSQPMPAPLQQQEVPTTGVYPPLPNQQQSRGVTGTETEGPVGVVDGASA